MPSKIALVDANDFYYSAEKIFRPNLAKVPVVALSDKGWRVVARDAIIEDWASFFMLNPSPAVMNAIYVISSQSYTTIAYG